MAVADRRRRAVRIRRFAMLGSENVMKKVTLAAIFTVSCALAASAQGAGGRGGVSSRGHGGGGFRSGGGHGSHGFGGSYRHHGGGGWGYRPYWRSSWWWGWPCYDGWGWGPRVYVSSGGYRVATSHYAAVKTDVEPDEAEVWLDGKYVGTADDFDGYP